MSASKDISRPINKMVRGTREMLNASMGNALLIPINAVFSTSCFGLVFRNNQSVGWHFAVEMTTVCGCSSHLFNADQLIPIDEIL